MLSDKITMSTSYQITFSNSTFILTQCAGLPKVFTIFDLNTDEIVVEIIHILF